MRLTIGRLSIAVSITLTILLVSILGGNNILVAARGLIPTPPPVTPPPPGTTPTPEVSVEPPGKKLPAYFVAIPSFAGKVLHWTKTDYSYNTTSPDPGNGRPVKVDIWARVGADAIPVISHAISTFPDGTFLQEVVQSPDTTTVILGVGYSIDSPDGNRECKKRLPAYPAWMRRQLLPPFVDEAILTRFGFKRSAGLTMEVPTTRPLASVQPLMTYSRDGTSQGWVLQQSKNGVANTKILVAGATGRVLVSRGQITDAKGNVINESWSTYGSLEVYDASSVPAATFAISQQALETCHG